MTQAQNAFDERYFELYVNPILHNLRKIIAKQVKDDASVIDIGCHTGEQSALLAVKCRRLVCFDTEEKHVVETRARLREYSQSDIDVIKGDWSVLPKFATNEFDYAVLMMTLHELDWQHRLPVFKQSLRISRNVIVADYIVPQPHTPHGAIARTAELLAGRKHFSNFQSFQKSGGLNSFEKKLKLQRAYSEINNVRTAEVVVYNSE